ncbi:LacI family DNA-binding transcriptional regulator [Microbacterium shaanxiense]
MGRPTLKDVAARAGVSASAVSYALNDASTVRLAEATKQRVRQAARELGYVPNGVARSLQARASRTIGVILGKALTLARYASIVDGLARGLRTEGFRISLLEEADALRGVDDVRAGTLDGLIFIGHDDQGVPSALRDAIAEFRIAFVAVDCGSGAEQESYPTVDFDYGEGVRQSLAFLTGVERLVYIRPGIDSYAEVARARAIEEAAGASALEVHTLTTDVTLETIARFDAGDADRSHHHTLVRQLGEILASWAGVPARSAVLCAWGTDAEAAYRTASMHAPGTQVVALAAGSLSPGLWPGLVYSRLPLEEGGRSAARFIVAAARGEDGADARAHLMLAPSLQHER